MSNCPICKSDKTKFFAKREPSEYHICKNCGSIYQPEYKLSMTEKKEFYDSAYQEGFYREYADRDLKIFHMSYKLKKILPYLPPPPPRKTAPNPAMLPKTKPRLLDIGCSWGFFVEVAMKAGFDAYGVELSPQAIFYADPAVKEKLINGDISSIKKDGYGKFDVITAFDVIEHLEDPVSFLNEIKTILNPRGIIVIDTFDCDGIIRRVMGKRLTILDPYQHINLFSRRSLKLALENSGYTVLKCLPIKKGVSFNFCLRFFEVNDPKLYKFFKIFVPKWLNNFKFLFNFDDFTMIAKENRL